MLVDEFRLDLRRDAGDAVRDLATEEVRRARNLITSRPEGALHAVHEFRKSMKGLRALARLVRSSLGGEFDPCNWALRDAARSLSDLRDEDALLEAVRALEADELEDAERALLEGTEQELLAHADRAALLAKLPERTSLALDSLSAAARRFGAVSLASYDDLEEGLLRTYRSARKHARKLERARDDTTLHSLRKRIKDHRFHLDLLLQSAPTMLGMESALAHEASELLGNDHDLVVLGARLPALRLDQAQKATLERLIEARRGRLQARAFEVCEELLEESPRQKTARVLGYITEFTRATTTRSGRPRAGAGISRLTEGE